MTLSEFKAWFEGFTEAMDGAPGPKAWKRICERVKEICAEPTPLPQIVREYVPQRYYGPYWSAYGVGSAQRRSLESQFQHAVSGSHQIACTQTIQSTDDAFRLIGRSDAESLQ